MSSNSKGDPEKSSHPAERTSIFISETCYQAMRIRSPNKAGPSTLSCLQRRHELVKVKGSCEKKKKKGKKE
jgi:hypothetical protein